MHWRATLPAGLEHRSARNEASEQTPIRSFARCRSLLLLLLLLLGIGTCITIHPSIYPPIYHSRARTH